MEDYFTKSFKELHEFVSNSRVFAQNKLERAKCNNASESYIKQLEVEYYALEVIWIKMNSVKSNRPR